jgi:hypothetical protein
MLSSPEIVCVASGWRDVQKQHECQRDFASPDLASRCIARGDRLTARMINPEWGYASVVCRHTTFV